MSSSSSPSSLPIVVVGCGLVGCMISLLLAQRGEKIILIEQREDFRLAEHAHSPSPPTSSPSLSSSSSPSPSDDSKTTGKLTNSLKRSINLALSHRGVSALKASGVFHRITSHLIPMRGRYMHSIGSDKLTFQPYGVGDQAIYSVSRGGLNILLLEELEKFSNVEVKFGLRVENITENNIITVTKTNKNKIQNDNSPSSFTISSRVVMGADGAFSKVRNSLSKLTRLNCSTHFIPHGYKELSMPPVNGEFAFSDWQGLHIWPRDEFMLIALPNPDKSFTCTLFAPFGGKDGLDSLTDDDKILNYFRKYFPDVIPLMPTLLKDFHSSPSSALVTVRVSPWNYKDKVVILGDAAHAVVPFYGQGMNAGFEDCLIMSELYDKFHGNWAEIIPSFSDIRNSPGLALADLSLENYVEMRHEVGSSLFLLKKRIENLLHYTFPMWWIPKYTMVAFTRIPYDEASKRAKKQEQILNGVVAVMGVATAAALIWGGVKYNNKNNISGKATGSSGNVGANPLGFTNPLPSVTSYFNNMFSSSSSIPKSGGGNSNSKL